MLTEKKIITTELGNVSIELESDKYGNRYIYRDEDTIAKTGFSLDEKIAKAFMELGRKQNQKEIEELKADKEAMYQSNLELQAINEKMKCCGNCAYHGGYYPDIPHKMCKTCANKSNWALEQNETGS